MRSTWKSEGFALVLNMRSGNPIVALFLALAFVAALGSTAFEYMVRLGYDQTKQKLGRLAPVAYLGDLRQFPAHS